MKKYIAGLCLLLMVVFAMPQKTSAAGDFLKPTSALSFLQSWRESLKMFFSFSKESKLNYLEELSNKRVSEIEDFGKNNATLTEKLAAKYELNYKDMEKLALQLQNKEQIAQKIEENSLRQQERLAAVYNQVPEQAKAAILNAQMNSSKNTAAVLEKVSPAKLVEYKQKIQDIQQAQMVKKVEMVEKQSGNEGGNPESQGVKSSNGLKEGKDLNKINGNNNAKSQGSEGKAQ